MKLHVVFSLYQLNRNIENIRIITSTIRELGGDVLADGHEAANARVVNKTINGNELDWDRIIKTHIKLASEADALIIEGTNYGFSSGFWSAFCVLNRKPALYLINKDLSQTRDINSTFLSGLIGDSFETHEYYNEEDLRKIVARFVKEHKQEKTSTNVELDKYLDNYLNSESRKKGVPKSVIIRDIIQKEHRTKQGIIC